MGKNRDIVDQINLEVETDSAGLGYKTPDGSWKSVDEIWNLGLADYEVDNEDRKTDRDFLAALGFVDVADVMDKFSKYANAHKGVAIAERAMRDYGEGGGVNCAHVQFRAALNYLSDSANMSNLGLAAGDALTAGQKNAILALGKTTTTRFAHVGIPTNRKHHIRRAREEWEVSQ